MNTTTETETAIQPPPEQPIRKYPLETRVRLSEGEEKKYGEQLAALVGKRRLLEDQAKQVASDYRTKIGDVKNEISRIADALNNGEELRMVEVYDIWNNGVIETRRQGDHAVVSSKPATLADRQTFFPGLDPDEEEDEEPDDPEPVISTPPGGAPRHDDGEHELDRQEHNGGSVRSAVGDSVHHMPDDDGGDDGDSASESGADEAGDGDEDPEPATADESPKGKADRRKAIAAAAKKNGATKKPKKKK